MLPLASGAFDLATLGCAFHWCEPAALVAELARVLRPGGELVVYDNGFFGEMRELPEAKDWFDSEYLPSHPSPPRGEPFDAAVATGSFRAEPPVFVDEWIPFEALELVRYLTTQSNVVQVVESGGRSLAEVEDALCGAVEALYRRAGTRRAHFRFGGLVHVLHRQSGSC